MTENVRREGFTEPRERIIGGVVRDLLELDLSAFQGRDDYADTLANTQAKANARSAQTLRQSKPGASPISDARRADRLRAGRTVITAAEVKARKTNGPINKAATKPVSRLQLQAEPSRNVRTDAARVSCKERPKNNKGSGGSRAFVPWCDRKR